MESNKLTSSDSIQEAEREKRLIEIFNKEIERDIAEKMVAITQINNNIKQCHKNLDQLRRVVTNKFYSDTKQKLDDEQQPSIHPAVKKLISKRPATSSETQKFMENNVYEWQMEMRRKRRRSESSHKKKSKAKNLGQNSKDMQVKPCYVPPVIPGNPQENSSLRGNTNKLHMRVLVGNVAKEVKGEMEGGATHKWMVYVRSAPGSLSLDKQVSKVCFYLHPSYKPHDVITILSPPFTLNRRGWGEFPLRVQLFFKNPLNKTAHVIHNLKLNGTRSGFHTRSAETFTDLWIYPYEEKELPHINEEKNSKEILWLASTMLKEEVPDFTSEVMCHKCKITSWSADVYKCYCDQENRVENPGANVTDTASGSEYSSSDMSESDDEVATGTKYLGSLQPSKRFKQQTLPFDQAFLKSSVESMKQEESKQLLHNGDSSMLVKPKIKADFNKVDSLSTDKTFVKVDQKREEASMPSYNTKLGGNFSPRFSSVKSDLIDLNVDPSDLFDELEKKPDDIKTGIKEQLTNSETVVNHLPHQERYDGNVHNTSASDYTTNNISFPTLMEIEELSNENSTIDCDNKIVTLLTQDSNPQATIDMVENPFDEQFIKDCESTIDKYLTEDYIEQATIEAFSEVTEELFDEKFISDCERSIDLFLTQNPQAIEEEKEVPVVDNNGTVDPFSNPDYLNQDLMKAIVEVKESHNENVIKDCENKRDVFLSKDSKSETNTALACQTIADKNIMIEEIPINDFIDNIVEEEIVVDEFSNTANENVSIHHEESVIVSSPIVEPQINKQIPDIVLKQNNRQISKATELQKPISSVTIPNIKNGASPRLKNESPTVNRPKNGFVTDQIHISNGLLKAKKPESTLKDCQPLSTFSMVKQNTPILVQSNKNDKQSNVLSLANSKNILRLSKQSAQSLLKPSVKNPNSLLKLNNVNISNNCSNQKTSQSMALPVQKTNIQHPTTSLRQIKPSGNIQVVSPKLSPNGVRNLGVHVRNSEVRQAVSNVPVNKIPQGSPNQLIAKVLKSGQQNRILVPNIQKSNAGSSQIPKTLIATSKLINLQQPSTKTISIVQHPNALPVKVIKQSLSPVGKNPNIKATHVNVLNGQVRNTAPVLQNSNQKTVVITSGLNTLQTKLLHNKIVVKKNVPSELVQRITNNLISPIKSDQSVISKPNIVKTNGLIKSVGLQKPSTVQVYTKDFPKIIQKLPIQINKSPIPTTLTKQPTKVQVQQDQSKTKELQNFDYQLHEVLSIQELKMALRIPDSSIVIDRSNSESKLTYGNILSSNNIHTNLKQLVNELPASNKILSYVKKDERTGFDSFANEHYVYYLHQLSLLVNSCKFLNPELAVRWLIRGMPLVHTDARHTGFKTLHPYCAPHYQLYCSWPRAKQAANEWLRAKSIKRLLKVLKAKGVGPSSVWSTREILRWSQKHGYCPSFIPSGNDSKCDDDEKIVCLLNKKTPPKNILQWMSTVKAKQSKSEEIVDVISLESKDGGEVKASRSVSPTPVDDGSGLVCGKQWVQDMHPLVKSQVAAVGAKLALEPLVPGGSPQPLVATILSHLAVSLAEDLTRRALAVCHSREGETVLASDVTQAILQRPEYDIFTQKGLEIDSRVNEALKKLKRSKQASRSS